ncbi:hypothetical protein RZN05_16315 [Sphingomonas sp. HF-S4]|uniref:Pyrrolo-quinoline quinone n=1 Tax=Sphingomonas agrestis TaxID=3080540 RepID=A0ABU3YAY3_9SPHN|nr:hypothetical protein [Sphingomonas sp. HF-S4]MDV3458563.1 hypothetical protein [Sphingomonas sp. HF-S4]
MLATMSHANVPVVLSAFSRRTALAILSTSVVAACSSGGGSPTPPPATPTPTPGPSPTTTPTPVSGPAWFGYGRDPQHTGVSVIASQDLGRVAWTSPVDLAPQYTPSGALLTHYGSPVVTTTNTVVIPVKTISTGGYRVEARIGETGALLWSSATDYLMPPRNWLPPYNLLLTPQGRLYAPGAGGKLLVRADPNAAAGSFAAQWFYGAAAYNANPAAFDSTVFINTPLTADANGNIFFGFHVTGTNPAGLVSGIARVSPDGTGIWVGVAAASSDGSVQKPAMNCAPALSIDGGTVYIAVNRGATTATQTGYLLALDSTTLATRARVALTDPNTLTPARISDDGTASPVVGPDGRVFYGVLETTFPSHNARGWLLQFDALLNPAGVPGSFGWDVSPSVIPASMVPSYTGTSTYLLAQKYNNYVGVGTGDGLNRMAVLDPKSSQADSIVPGVQVMREVLTILGPTLDGSSPTSRREWCINTMAADPARRSILANNEDGILYRWDLSTNTLSQSVRLNTGLGQAYTPTLIGADGGVYAISNATLYAIRGV